MALNVWTRPRFVFRNECLIVQGATLITGPDDVTAAVLTEVERAKNPRTKELLAAGVKHLHAFVRETNLTEAEFQHIARVVAKLGQLSNESHNEVVLIAGSLGVSALVCLQNNGESGEFETTANLMGPFWREGHRGRKTAPRSCGRRRPATRSSSRAPSLTAGNPVEGAEVDVWNTSGEGIYENQDPGQADMNLRGKFVTDENGQYHVPKVKPAGYPIPINGPVGDLLRAQGGTTCARRTSTS